MQRHSYTDQAKANERQKSFLDLGIFKSSVSYRKVRDIQLANPNVPVCLLGCGWSIEQGTGKQIKKLPGPYYWATPSYLEGVRFLDLVKMLTDMHPGERNHCTMVLAEKPVHVFVDFDAGSSTEPDHVSKDALYRKVQGREEQVQIEWRRLFNTYFQQVYGRLPDLSGLHWETASTTGKFSLHAHLTTEAFETVDHHKRFMAGFVAFLKTQPESETLMYYCAEPNPKHKKQVALLIDDTVYTKNRNFRLIECCKPGKQPLRWIPDSGHIISKEKQKQPSIKELVFRGMISYSIDVDECNLLRFDTLEVNSPALLHQRSIAVACTAAHAQVNLPLDNLKEHTRVTPETDSSIKGGGSVVSKAAVSPMAQSTIQCILSDGKMLGPNVRVNACHYTVYLRSNATKTVCLQGDCRVGTAACMWKSDHSVSPVKMYYHENAASSFVISENDVKLRDWACGQDQVSIVPLSTEQRSFVRMIMKDASRTGSSNLAHDHSLTGESDSESDIESEASIQSSASQSISASTQVEGHYSASVQSERVSRGESATSASSLSDHHDGASDSDRSSRKRKAQDDLQVPADEGVKPILSLAQSSILALPSRDQRETQFNPWGLHTVDCHLVRDTRPLQSSIEEIVKRWEDSRDTRHRVKKAKRKYSGRDQKQELNCKLQELQKELWNDIVAYLNQYFKLSIRIPEPLVIVTLVAELDGGKHREWQSDYFAIKSFLVSYSYLNVTVQGRTLKVAQMWLDHSQCARFDQIIFQPAPDGQIIPKDSETSCNHNLWTGFKISSFDATRYMQSLSSNSECARHLICPLLHHIWSIWCRGSRDLYEYTMNWMAWCIQKPHIKTGVALVIRGDKGSGKGIVMDVLGKIFGRKHYYHAQRAEQLLGDFNDHLQSCLLCFVDEVTFADDVRLTNVLKGMVTESTININTKFKSRMVLDSYMNLVLAGNMAKLVECEGNERRYFVLETDNRWSGQQTQATADYFARIRSVPPEILRAFLSRRDISGFNPRSMPFSAAMRDQKALSLIPLHRWWNECLVRGYVAQTADALTGTTSNQLHTESQEGVSDEEWMEQMWQRPLQKDMVIRSFGQWCRDAGIKRTDEASGSFWKSMHDLLKHNTWVDGLAPGAESLLKFTRPVCKAVSGQSSTTRVHMVHFPSLKLSRKLFCQNVVHDEGWCFDQQGENCFSSNRGILNDLPSDNDLGVSVLPMHTN